MSECNTLAFKCNLVFTVVCRVSNVYNRLSCPLLFLSGESFQHSHVQFSTALLIFFISNFVNMCFFLMDLQSPKDFDTVRWRVWFQCLGLQFQLLLIPTNIYYLWDCCINVMFMYLFQISLFFLFTFSLTRSLCQVFISIPTSLVHGIKCLNIELT